MVGATESRLAMGRYAIHQTDENEAELVSYLRLRGAQVEKIHQPVDLLVTFHGVTAVAEVKTVRGNVNAAQRAFLERWEGISAILRTEMDCDQLLERMLTPDLDYLTRRAVGAREPR